MFLTKCVDLEVFVGLSRAALGLPHQNRMGDPDFIMSKQVTDRSRELLDWAVEKTKKDDEKKTIIWAVGRARRCYDILVIDVYIT